MKLLRGFWPAPLVAGALMWASFPPLDAGWLNVVAWALLFLSMRLRRGEKAGRQAFVAALVLFVPGLSWIRPLVWPLWLVVAAWCAMWEALFGRLARRAFAAEGVWWVLAVPALHLLADMLRTDVMTGFPWLLPGYSAWRNPLLMDCADLIGVHGVTLAILVFGACVADALAQRIDRRPRAVIWPQLMCILGIAAMLGWSAAKGDLDGGERRSSPRLLLLQANIAQKLKEDRVRSGEKAVEAEAWWAIHERLAKAGIAASRERRIDAVVWPETMVPAFAVRPFRPGTPLATVEIVDPELHTWRATLADGRRLAQIADGAASLAGVASFRPPQAEQERGDEYNTVVLLDAQGRVVGWQDKQHLTPGGEYVPYSFLIPFRTDFYRYLERMVGFLPDLRPGDRPYLLPVGGARCGVLVCYESVFPEIPREMARGGADFLVNCSNYGWFTGTAEMEQALAMACFRAAELHRSVVLSSNNGISCVIGPDGRVTADGRLDADHEGFLVADVPIASSSGPFTAIGEWGAWTVGALGLVGTLLTGRARRRLARDAV